MFLNPCGSICMNAILPGRAPGSFVFQPAAAALPQTQPAGGWKEVVLMDADDHLNYRFAALDDDNSTKITCRPVECSWLENKAIGHDLIV